MNASPSPETDPPWTSPFEELLRSEPVLPSEPLPRSDAHRPPPLFGTPMEDAGFWEGPQKYPDDCAIKCQQFILERFTGEHTDEQALVRESWQHGWYTPGAGTRMEDVGKLLELHGVQVHSYQHASIFHLAQELAEGHKVIVGVDGKELVEGNPLNELFDQLGLAQANHAVVVSGIDTRDPDHVRVLVSDPGTGQAIATYPLEQFLDAWRDSDFLLMATNEPAPPHLPEMAHFDYHLGHLPEVADMPYDQFLSFADHAADWDSVLHPFVEVHDPLHLPHLFDNGLTAAPPPAEVEPLAFSDGGHDLTMDHPHGDVLLNPSVDPGHLGDDLLPHDPL